MDFGWCGEDGLSKKIRDKSSKSIFSIRFNIFMAEALGKPSSWISGNPAFLRSFPAASWAASCSPSKLASESESSSFSGFLSAFVLPAGVISCSKQNMYSEIRRGIFQKYYCILWFYIYIYFFPFDLKPVAVAFTFGGVLGVGVAVERREEAGLGVLESDFLSSFLSSIFAYRALPGRSKSARFASWLQFTSRFNSTLVRCLRAGLEL